MIFQKMLVHLAVARTMTYSERSQEEEKELVKRYTKQVLEIAPSVFSKEILESEVALLQNFKPPVMRVDMHNPHTVTLDNQYANNSQAFLFTDPRLTDTVFTPNLNVAVNALVTVLVMFIEPTELENVGRQPCLTDTIDECFSEESKQNDKTPARKRSANKRANVKQ